MSEKTKVIGAATGSLGLGSFAAAIALCCTVPWAVAILGVTGAVAFARLSFLLPYAVIGAAGLLALAFWWAYRAVPGCADGSCALPDRRGLRWFVWSAAVLVVAFSVAAFTMRLTLP